MSLNASCYRFMFLDYFDVFNNKPILIHNMYSPTCMHIFNSYTLHFSQTTWNYYFFMPYSHWSAFYLEDSFWSILVQQAFALKLVILLMILMRLLLEFYLRMNLWKEW